MSGREGAGRSVEADRVLIFDTTLRDGEQAPGCTMTRDEKLAVARQLARLKVDVIEAGFPASSPGDWEAVRAIAGEVGTADGPVICGLARASEADIDRCATAVAPAARRRIHTFLATSDLHLRHKLGMTRARALETARRAVVHARALADDVEFSAEDAGRSDPAFLHEVLAAAAEAGATTLNIPDTVGYTTPEEYGAMIAGARAAVPGADRLVFSTHCHDDLGLAVANSLAGVRAGARQVECTVNGIGERAGNAALEEVVMALRTRAALFGAWAAADTRELARTSRLVARCSGVRVPPNKAVVGANAFAHEAGIHQDGVLKERATYEIMSPDMVGLDGNRLVLGKHSGRHAVRRRLEEMGHALDEEEFAAVFARFKEIGDRKKVVDERDLDAIAASRGHRRTSAWELALVRATCGSHAPSEATVGLKAADGETVFGSAHGDGPVDAVCRAIASLTGDRAELEEFTVDAITEGVDAAGGVHLRLRERDTGELFAGYGVHTDIVVAAAEAYVAAVNALARLSSADGPRPSAAVSRAEGLGPRAEDAAEALA
ncbi:MAG: 2-isopropylmalate synthase [Gemmatimonadaceae bacterium]